MGGVEADIDGRTAVENIWAAGEVACHSLHGANRLGCNSTAECLVWGGITGEEIAKTLTKLPAPAPVPAAKVQAAHAHIEELKKREGKENLYELRRQLRAIMDTNVGVFRTGEKLAAALTTVRELRARSLHAPVVDKGTVYNSNLFHALELENLLDLAEVTVMGALARQESRGAHARRDFATRDDEKWLKHTLAWKTDAVPRLDHKGVTINTWKPVERKY
jgi:succinate dehydrogenase / fumarate reductase flavoprotein subunit